MTTATTPAAAPAPTLKEEFILLSVNNQPAVFRSLLGFHTEQALGEFIQQFDILRQQFGRFQGLSHRRDQALTTAEKDALGKVLEQEANDLNSKDALFQKAYGFRIAGLGNRICKIQQTRRLLIVATDEELAKAKQDKNFKAEDIVTIEGKQHLVASTMSGLAYDDFERNYGVVKAKQLNLVNAKAAAEKATGEEKTRIDAFVKEREADLIKDNEIMSSTYRFSLGRSFVLDFIDAKLFVMLTPEEVQRVQEAKQGEVDAKKPAADKAKN